MSAAGVLGKRGLGVGGDVEWSGVLRGKGRGRAEKQTSSLCFLKDPVFPFKAKGAPGSVVAEARSDECRIGGQTTVQAGGSEASLGVRQEWAALMKAKRSALTKLIAQRWPCGGEVW